MLKGSYSWYTVDAYDAKGRLSRQVVDGSPIEYEYTKYGQLAAKHLGGKLNPDASVTYEYSKSGQIVARTANGIRQTYEYDKKGQLLGVKEGEEYVERYAYDRAGNMVKKVVRGSRFVVRDGVETLVRDGEYKTTTFTFDDANQLVSSTIDGVTTRYEYDAAGRMIKEGDKTYTYGYLDKVMSVRFDRSSANSSTSQPLNSSTVYTYTYHPDGQLATADYGRARTPAAPQGEDSPSFETFTWDGLALIQRGNEHFINEPHVGGGNPVVSSKGTSYFNDMLGTTVGAKSGKTYSAATLSAFGEDLTVNAAGDSSHSPFPVPYSPFFTGKPKVAGLGHAFLMRNYRASLGKWQTADPMGYPDGWNQLAYCGNGVTGCVDLWGGATVYTWEYKGSDEAWGHASLELTNGTYISWWPADNVVSNNVVVVTNRHYILNTGYIDIYSAVAITNNFSQDVFQERGEPSTTNVIDGLDEAAIEKYWQNLVTNSLWQSYNLNCSKTVAEALKAGGAEVSWLDWCSSWNVIWSPSDVANYASAIESYYIRITEVRE